MSLLRYLQRGFDFKYSDEGDAARVPPTAVLHPGELNSKGRLLVGCLDAARSSRYLQMQQAVPSTLHGSSSLHTTRSFHD